MKKKLLISAFEEYEELCRSRRVLSSVDNTLLNLHGILHILLSPIQ